MDSEPRTDKFVEEDEEIKANFAQREKTFCKGLRNSTPSCQQLYDATIQAFKD